MTNAKEKSFDFANDSIKLVLSLATGVLAFNITFLKDIVGTADIEKRALLLWSWGALLVCMLFCLITIFAIAGSLDKLSIETDEAKKKAITIYSSNVVWPAGTAILAFLLGIILNVFFSSYNF